jgi:hypothetical protein
MTDDDKRRQKADLLLEFEDLKDHIAHLNEAAWRQKEFIFQVSKWLENSRFLDNSPNIEHFAEINSDITKSIGDYRAAMDFDRVSALVKELSDARIKFDELKKRKQSLGLK